MPAATQAFPGSIDHFGFAVINIGIGFACKYIFNGIGSVYFIPRIHEQYIIASSELQALVHGVVNALIRLANQFCYAVAIVVKDIQCAVSRGAINDDILDVFED